MEDSWLTFLKMGMTEMSACGNKTSCPCDRDFPNSLGKYMMVIPWSFQLRVSAMKYHRVIAFRSYGSCRNGAGGQTSFNPLIIQREKHAADWSSYPTWMNLSNYAVLKTGHKIHKPLAVWKTKQKAKVASWGHDAGWQGTVSQRSSVTKIHRR